ncbi:MAG TPA: ABC transporter permease [Actinomycetota bacterium]|nr:ABC transporter permease [Actinomycetota bacterium]
MRTLRAPDAVTSTLGHPVAGPAIKAGVPVVGLFVVSRYLFGATYGGMFSGVALGSLYGILAVAIILIYRTNRIINFAAAALGAIPGVTACLLLVIKGWPWLVCFPLAIVGGAALGGIADVLIIRRFARSPRLILTVATIGLAQFLAYFAFMIPIWMGSAGRPISYIPTPFKRFVFTLGNERFSGDYPFSIVGIAIVVTALALFLRYTRMGVALRASAENADRASLLGIPVKRVQTVSWVIAGTLAAFTIYFRAALVGVPTDGSLGYKVLIFALAAAVVARMESIPVALVAGMGAGVLGEASVVYTGRDSLATAIMFGVILAALLLQRGKLSRAYDAGVSTWQTVKEFRPTPHELRRLPEVIGFRAGVYLIAGLFLLLLPNLVGVARYGDAQILVIYSIIAVSLVVLTGWAGQISLGQFGIVGISAALAGKMAADFNMDFFLSLAVGVAAGTVAAVLVGIPAVRIQGLYLAVTTLSFSAAVEFYFLNDTYLVGRLLRPDRASQIEVPVLWQRVVLTEGGFPGRGYYYLCLAALGGVVLAARAYRRNRAGRVLMAVRENPRAAASYSVNPTRTKLAAFAVSGAIASLGGVLMSYQLRAIDQSTYGIELSIYIFMIAVIGGLTSIGGVIVATFVIHGIYLFGRDWLPGIQFLVTGPGLLLVLMVLPGGFAEVLYGARDAFLRWVANRHGLHVPSLVADRRIEPDEAEEHVVSDAQRQTEELEAVGPGPVRGS